MRWEDLFDDLEGQAESLERAEREAEVADRTRSEVGQITLMSRLRSNEGREISLRLTGGASFSGTLVRLGTDWMLLACPREVVVPLSGVATLANLPWDVREPLRRQGRGEPAHVVHGVQGDGGRPRAHHGSAQ